MVGGVLQSEVFRISRRLRLCLGIGLLFTIAAFLLTPASPIGFGHFARDDELWGKLFFTAVFACFALLFLGGFLTCLRHRLVVDPHQITAYGLFQHWTVDVPKIESAIWKKSRLAIKSDGRRRMIVLENYPPADRIRLVEKLHALIPASLQSGWEIIEFAYLRPPPAGANRHIIKLICRACLIGTACNVVLTFALKSLFPFWPDSAFRLLFVILVASLAFPVMLCIRAVVNVLLKVITGEDP